jgi:hypothetical protein
MQSWTLARDLHIRVPETYVAETASRRHHMAAKKSSRKFQKGKKLLKTTTLKKVVELPAVQ